ncbi:MAG: zinc dependent phospholipase C family protein [Firmicutes bacterium]|nr:zinc dependent phospholipase C family protein [Bacillota bacterium]
MPSGYLHKRCAERALLVSGVTPVPNEAFILGSQGPDPLFALGMFPLRTSNKPLPHANTLHTTRTGLFLRSLAKHSREKSAAERAFTMGFLTHYALDSTVHPYVYAHSLDAKGRYSSLLHMRLEKRWDTLYFHRDGHAGTSVVMPGVRESKPYWPRIAAVWAEAVRDVYPDMDLDEADIRRALADTERANRLTHSPRGVKYAFAWALERLIAKPMLVTAQMGAPFLPRADIENNRCLPWRDPADPDHERTEGLTELFERAVLRAAELVKAAWQYFDRAMDDDAFSHIVGNIGYNTGMMSKP